MIYTEIVGMETQVTQRSNPTVNAQGGYMAVTHLSVFGTSLGRCLFFNVKGSTKSILHAEYTLQMFGWVFRLYGHVLNTTHYSLVSLTVELEQELSSREIVLVPTSRGGRGLYCTEEKKHPATREYTNRITS